MSFEAAALSEGELPISAGARHTPGSLGEVARDLLAACEAFLAVNERHGYEFDSNEPEVFAAIQGAVSKARGVAQADDPSPLLAAAEALWADRNARPDDQDACRRLYDAWRALGAAITKAKGA